MLTKEKLKELFPIDPLPDFVDPASIRISAADVMLPPERMPVSEAAVKYRFVNNPGGYVGPWNNETAPYMVEPMDVASSREFDRLVLAGSAQSLKTDSLVINSLVHTITCEPLTTMVLQTTQAEARKFSRGRIDTMIRDCDEVARRMSPNRDDNNVHDKRFKGMDLLLAWPTIASLSGTPIPRVIFTDYDRMDQDVGGEGEPFDLGHKRSQSFGSRRMTIAESSPGRPILKAGWTPPADKPHLAPPTTGILALYNRGDRRRRYWYCPECGEPFEPQFGHLHIDLELSIDNAAQATHMVCPHNGCVIEHHQKNEIDRQGVWLKEGQTTNIDREIVGDGIQSKIASFWAFGVIAALSSWEELVRNYLLALEEFELNGKEDPLKTTINVDQGDAYLPKALQDVKKVNAETLIARAKAEGYQLGTVPEGVRFLTAAVDTQENRFEVKVEGWGEYSENWTIDYFQIFKPKSGDRMLDPTQFDEDWDLILEQVVDRIYPLADGSGRGMSILIAGVDMQGMKGASDKAYGFWRRAKLKGYRNRLRLFRGDPKLKEGRFRETFPDSQRKDRKAIARGEVPVIGFNSNEIKSEVFNSLQKTEPGPGFRHHPAGLVDIKGFNFFDMMTAEELKGDGWEKVRARNEAWDLTYYNRGLWLYKKCDRIRWNEKLPDHAKPWDENPYVVEMEQTETGAFKAKVATEKRSIASKLA